MRNLLRVIIIAFLFSFSSSIYCKVNFWEPTGTIGGTVVLSIAIFPNGMLIVATSDSELYQSTNQGNSWEQMAKIVPSLPRSQTRALFIHPTGNLFVFRHGSDTATGGIFYSADTGKTWTHGHGSYGDWYAIGLTPSGDLLAFGNSIIKSTDSGVSWQYSGVGGVVGNSTPFQSTVANEQGYVFAGSDNGVYRSSNNGTLWSQTVLSTGRINSLITFPGGIVIAGTEGVGIWRSTDNGTSWNITSTGVSSYYRAFAKDSNGNLYAAMHNTAFNYKIVQSIDSGKSWNEISSSGLTNMYDSSVTCFAVSPNGYLYAGTAGGKVFRSFQPVTDIKDNFVLPKTYTLNQNYPNPFNPSTRITFTLLHSSTVSLKVFDLLGREVTILKNGREEAGEHTINWDATAMQSGVYFYRLITDGWSEMKKMIFMK